MFFVPKAAPAGSLRFFLVIMLSKRAPGRFPETTSIRYATLIVKAAAKNSVQTVRFDWRAKTIDTREDKRLGAYA